MKMKTEEFTL